MKIIFKKGDKVRHRPKYRDPDDKFIYMLIEEPDGDRVKIQPIDTNLSLPPIEVVKLEWIEKL